MSPFFCGWLGVEPEDVWSASIRSVQYERSIPLVFLSDFNPFNATLCVVEEEGVDFGRRDLSLSLSEKEEIPDCDFIVKGRL